MGTMGNMREDLELKQYALDNGFKVVEPSRYGDPLTFKIKKVVLWQTSTGWQSASLVGGYYRNHLPFGSLKEALDYWR